MSQEDIPENGDNRPEFNRDSLDPLILAECDRFVSGVDAFLQGLAERYANLPSTGGVSVLLGTVEIAYADSSDPVSCVEHGEASFITMTGDNYVTPLGLYAKLRTGDSNEGTTSIIMKGTDPLLRTVFGCVTYDQTRQQEEVAVCSVTGFSGGALSHSRYSVSGDGDLHYTIVMGKASADRPVISLEAAQAANQELAAAIILIEDALAAR